MDQHGATAPPRPAKLPGSATRLPHRPLVTLSQPRPDSERRLNAYVETPARGSAAPAPADECATGKRQQRHLRPSRPQQQRPPVTTQPPSKRALTDGGPADCPPDSIICSSCGRCRCAQCARPRPLPSRWFCGSCLCSAETAIDYASCMCLPKAVFYHFCKDDGDGASCADEPCSCTGSRRGARWGCLAALAAAMPCLLCYWPLRGAAALCAGAYARTGPAGCRCKPPTRR